MTFNKKLWHWDLYVQATPRKDYRQVAFWISGGELSFDFEIILFNYKLYVALSHKDNIPF